MRSGPAASGESTRGWCPARPRAPACSCTRRRPYASAAAGFRAPGPTPTAAGRGRVVLARPHVDPGDAATLRAVGTPCALNLVLEVALGWLVGHVDAVARGVELPAVVHAAHAALLRCAPKNSDAPRCGQFSVMNPGFRRVAPGDQVLAQDADALGLAVGLELPRVDQRQPVVPHQVAHRRPGADPRQQLSVFLRQHASILRPIPRAHAWRVARPRRAT